MNGKMEGGVTYSWTDDVFVGDWKNDKMER
jgi:hypothetical protein